MSECPSRGKTNTDIARFCSYCGYSLVSSSAYSKPELEPVASSVYKQASPQRAHRGARIGLGVVIGLILLAFFVYNEDQVQQAALPE